MRIGVDIDDVLYPWSDLAHALCEKAGITNGKTWTCWTPWRDYGCSEEQWLHVLSIATLDGRLYGGAPIDGAGAQVARLQDAGHSVHLVTARGQFVHGSWIMKDTVTWLKSHAIGYDSLTFSRDKTLIPVDWFIEDNLDNYDALEAARGRPVLLNRPHNQPRLIGAEQRPAYCWRRRVDTLEQFVDLVLEVRAA